MAETYIIGGKRWRVRICRLPKGTDGECDPPDTPKKEIRISDRLSGVDLLDTIIHEVKHARNWHDHDEDYVAKSATEDARLLYGMGYRKAGS